MTEQTSKREPYETRRWKGREVRAFAAMDTMAQIADRVLAIVGEGRTMNKASVIIHNDGLEDLDRLDHMTGLHKGGHAAYPAGHNVWHTDDQAGFAVHLTHGHGSRSGTLEGFGVGIMAYKAGTEQQVRARYEKGEKATSVFDERREITQVKIKGAPGEPHREDRIEIKDWNDSGVLTHTIITFVEPDYCDSGRIVETNYVILVHRKDPSNKRQREEDGEVFARFTGHDLDLAADLDKARAEVSKVRAQPDIEFAWLVTEKVTRERHSV